jgi:MraZ protein
VPAKFRAILGNEFIFKVNRSKYPSIQLYSKAQFQKEVDEALAKITDEYNKKRAEAKRYLGAGEAVCDAQGRIVLTRELLEFAEIEKTAVIVGCSTYAEIWSSENWAVELESENVDDIRLELERFGL